MEAKVKLARWINKLRQFEFYVNHRPGSILADANALSRLAVDLPFEETNLQKVSEGTEDFQFEDAKYTIPGTLVHKVLQLYQDTGDAGIHCGFWCTYNKLVQRFRWNHMKEDIWKYVTTCYQCQLHQAEYRPRTNEMVLPKHPGKPFKTVHLDFADIKKSPRIQKTQAHLICIDQGTRRVAVRPGKEDANSVIRLLEWDVLKMGGPSFLTTDLPAFVSERLWDWGLQRRITLQWSSSYHPAANGMAERVIQDLQQHAMMYPTFKGVWKRCLTAELAHHNVRVLPLLGAILCCL